MCDEYAQRDSRIKIIHKHNGGVGSARNAGLDIACGEWIYFADSDDEIELYALEELFRLGKEEDSDLIVGGYLGIGLKGKVRWNVIPNGVATKSGKDMLLNSQIGVPWGLVWCNLYKSSLWNQVRFPENVIGEDCWTMPYIYLNAQRMTTYPNIVYRYYEHKGSIMHTEIGVKQMSDSLKVLAHLFSLYKLEQMYILAEQNAMHFIYKYMQCNDKIKSDFEKDYNEIIKYILFSTHVGIKNKLRLIKNQFNL